MNAHTPFDAKKDWSNPYCQNSSNDPMVDALLGNAYHVVRTVYCNLGNLKLIYDFLNQYGMVLGVQSEAELKALTTKAKYARIYGFSRAGDRQVTDYLYVEGDRTGILPNDTTATGSWITVATSGSAGGSTSSGGGAYIPWVYSNGSAAGGETTINVPDGTVGVPFIIVNGDMQYVGRGFEFNIDSLSVTLTQPLEEGDEVVFLLTGVPAVPDNPNVNDWVQINWLYNQGAAVGGEQVIAIPYTFQAVPAVYKNGLRLYKGLTTESYTTDPDNQRILLTEPLATNDRLIVQISGEAQVLEASDHTIQEVARATNVKDSEVILSTDTVQLLNGKKVIYSISEQKAYGLPVLPSNIYISSVSNGQLTYSPGNITVDLVPVPNPGIDVVNALRADLVSEDLEQGDNLLTVKQPFTGSVVRTQHSKNTDLVSVKDFGAKGDGVTDDTAAIQAAFTWVASSGDGRKLTVNQGKYLLTQAITVNVANANFVIAGEGRGVTQFVWTSSATSAGFVFGNTTPITKACIYGFTMNTKVVTSNAAISITCDGSTPNSVFLYDIIAYGDGLLGTAANGYFGGGLAQLTDANAPLLQDMVFYGVDGDAADFGLVPAGVTIQALNHMTLVPHLVNVACSYVGYGMYVNSVHVPGIEGIVFDRCNSMCVYGIKVTAENAANPAYYPPQVNISNTQVEYYNTAFDMNHVSAVFIDKCTMLHNPGAVGISADGVVLNNVNHASITNNYVEARPGTTTNGVHATGASTSVVCIGNSFSLPAGKAGVLYDGTVQNSTQHNNVCTGGGTVYVNTSTNKASNSPEGYLTNGERSTVLPDGTIMKSGSRVVTLGTDGSFTVDWVSPFPNGIDTCLPLNGDSAASTGVVTLTEFNATGMIGVVSGGTSGSPVRINYMAVGF